MSKPIFTSLAISAVFAGQLFAQGQTVPVPLPQPVKPVQQPAQNVVSNAQQIEQHAAACLLIGNQEEIALSQFGEERAKSDKVKEFAREMTKEHTKFLTKLRKFTPQQASFELSVKADPPVGDKPLEKKMKESLKAAPAQARAANSESVMDQLLTLKRDQAHECLTLTKECLEEHKGHDFDKAFMGAQVSAHISMLAQLRAMKGKTVGEFADLVKEGEQATQEHLEAAQKVMGELSADK